MLHRARVTVAVVLSVASLFAAVSAARAEQWVVHMPNKGRGQVEDIQRRGIEILAFTRDGFDVRVDDKQLDYLLSQSYPVSAERMQVPDLGTAALDANLGLYHTYAEMESVLTDWEATYSSILDVFSIGLSIEGRTMYALKISDNVGVDEDEPEVLFMANLHAREIMTVEMVMGLADYLLSNYGSDATVTSDVDNREIYMIPMCNPDGHVYVENNHGGSSGGWWRLNRRQNANLTYGVDLNRNFGYQWGYDDVGSSPVMGNIVYRGTGPFSEPETQAIRNFVNARNFTMWLSYHSYGELLLYPWGYVYADTPDNDVFAALGDTLTSANGYLAGNPKNGAIYITNGDSDDWGYGDQTFKDKVFAFTPEINSYADGGFGPDDSYIDPTFNLLLPMNLDVLALADNPYRVVGPYPPAQYAVSEPWANAVHRVSWTASDPADPNPVDHYEVRACRDPGWVTDDGLMLSLWDSDGFASGTGHTGTGYASGSGDAISHTLTMLEPYVVDTSSDTLAFWITYDIESDYDYGYVEASTNGGGSWSTVAGSITTTYNPHGNNAGDGITGTSGGWVYATFPMTAYSGQDVLVRFRYTTDGALIRPGYTIDDITPVATCGSVTTLATADADTTLDVAPTVTDTFRYRVRGIDAEGQASRWSNTEDYTVATLTGADGPLSYRTALGDNYPNPFNPDTRIPYAVGGRAAGGADRHVTLRVYAVTGALVATLVDAVRAPGTFEAHWNGTSDAGEAVASGIYFACLVAGNEMPLTRKLVLLK